METYKTEILDFHNIKTRKSGAIRYIDFHITVNPELTAKDIHELTKRLEKSLEEKIKNINLTIHIDHS